MNIALIVFLVAFTATFILRIPIGFGMIMSSIFYFLLADGPAAPVSMMATQFLSQMNVKFVLIAVPLFIFAAKVMNTGEITDMIEGIQGESARAVESMEEAGQLTGEGKELADKSGSSLNEIVTMSQRVMDMIQQMATATEEQSAAAEQISKNIEHVSSITKETATGAEQSATAAEQLNRQAEGMKQMVGQFKIS